MSSCGGGGCGGGGGCANSEAAAAGEAGENLSRLSVSGELAACYKCGEESAAFNSLCVSCFRTSMFGKFKLAVTSNAMISPTDNVLVAFSGGPASRVALQYVHEMQSKAQKSWDLSRSQALPVFGVGVAFIDESVFSLAPSHESDKGIEEIKVIVSELAPPLKELHIMPIQSVCSLGLEDGVSRLNELLGAIPDVTGKEDFMRYLRMLSLQKIAMENKYSKLMLGSCTSAIARHILCATVKGQGYSLPADLQYVDSRWKVPVVLPLRDCLEQEVTMLCHFDSLKTQQLFSRPCTGINGLVSSFVGRLLEENPSRERTIVRTAGKLKPFSFNKLIEDGYQDFLPSRLRPKFQNGKTDGSTSPVVLCSICGSPLSESELLASKDIQGKTHSKIEMFVGHCCQSCCFQILPKNEASLEKFFSVVPQSITGKFTHSHNAECCPLREQIKDFLLSDDDDGT